MQSLTPPFVRAGPKARATHWKQSVMYLEDRITICEGECLTGTLSVARNKLNPRDLDMVLEYSFEGKKGQAKRVQQYKMR